MPGVQVPAGEHTVEFVFHIPLGLPLLISASAIGFGLALIGVLLVSGRMNATRQVDQNRPASLAKQAR
jgi:hypothetical protein